MIDSLFTMPLYAGAAQGCELKKLPAKSIQTMPIETVL
jgi:hypothetical protein